MEKNKMNFWYKRKDVEKTRKAPPAMTRFGNTDFVNKAEFVQLHLLGIMPLNIGRREGEAQIDEKIYAEELYLIGINKNSPEFEAAMKIYRNSFTDETKNASPH